MSLIERWLVRSRIKDARRKLAQDPSPKNYLQLANEHARAGAMGDAGRVCAEALEVFPGHVDLLRLAERTRALQLEDRARELTRELHEAPRPSLYRELAELYLASGRLERAEELATEWLAAGGEGPALLLRAQARIARYRSDKRREDGRMCFELLDAAERQLPRDERPVRMRLDLCCAIGAWRDARKAIGQLLETRPGDPALEARFRTYNSLADKAPAIDAALRDIERTGRLAEDHGPAPVDPATSRAIRPKLKDIAAQPAVEAAVFERGATALVQGPTGATAERCARAVREIVQKSRTTARRLGLGSASEIEIESQFGSVLIAPGESGSAAVWCSQPSVPERLRSALLELVGGNVESGEEEVA